MKNKKGQALVEFVIILPVFLLLAFAIIDYGRIIYTMNTLEGVNNDLIYLFKDGKSYDELLTFVKKENKKATLVINEDEEYIEFIINCKLEIITPGLGLIIDNPYDVEVSRVIYNE